MLNCLLPMSRARLGPNGVPTEEQGAPSLECSKTPNESPTWCICIPLRIGRGGASGGLPILPTVRVPKLSSTFIQGSSTYGSVGAQRLKSLQAISRGAVERYRRHGRGSQRSLEANKLQPCQLVQPERSRILLILDLSSWLMPLRDRDHLLLLGRDDPVKNHAMAVDIALTKLRLQRPRSECCHNDWQFNNQHSPFIKALGWVSAKNVNSTCSKPRACCFCSRHSTKASQWSLWRRMPAGCPSLASGPFVLTRLH